MGYALLWIEALTACALLVAAVAACSARLSRRWLRVAVPTLTALVPGLAGVAAVVAGALFARMAQMHAWVFWYAASWTLSFALAAALVLRRALRADGRAQTADKTARPAGVAWPRGKLAVATAAACILSVTTVWNMNLAAQNTLAAIRAEAGALALSLTPSRPPDSENAALVYEKAFELMPKDERMPDISEEADGDEVRAFLAEHEAALSLLRRAAGMTACYFEYSSAIPDVEALMPILRNMRRGARLLALDARLKAADGQAGPALRDVAAVFGMARHAGENPVLIQALVAMAIGGIGHAALQDVLADCEPSESDLRALLAEDTFSYWRLMRRSARMERAFGLATSADVYEGTGGTFFLNEIAGNRSMMLEYDKALDLPYHQARERLEQVRTQAQEGRWGILQAMLCPALARAAAAAAEAEAARLLDSLALAATAYRIRHGEFPAEPADLVPEFLMLYPEDPFDGAPMRMVPQDGELLFYSIGADLKDDAGAEWVPEKRAGDLTFRLGSPPPE